MLFPSLSTLVSPYARLHQRFDENATLTVYIIFPQLAQQVIPHLSDARSAKSAFQLATVLSYAKQTAMSTVAKDLRPGASYWDAVGEAIAQLAGECNKILPIALESENVVKSTFLFPCCRPSHDSRHVRQSPARRPGSCASTKSEQAQRSTSRQSAKPCSYKTRFRVLFAVSSRETRPSKSRPSRSNSWNAAWKRARSNRIRSANLRRSSRKRGNRSERMRRRWSNCKQIWMPSSRITPSSRPWPHQRDKV